MHQDREADCSGQEPPEISELAVWSLRTFLQGSSGVFSWWWHGWGDFLERDSAAHALMCMTTEKQAALSQC